MDIRIYGDPVLREQSHPVDRVDDEHRQLAEEMLKIMYAENGVGLAAEQVGRTEALCVIDIPPQLDTDKEGNRQNPDIVMPLALINPEIVEISDETVAREEGCLSFPRIYAPITRAFEARAVYLNRDGKEREIQARGFLARAILHEVDHLNGVLMVDRMSAVKKIALSGRLKRLRKETRERIESYS